MFLTIGRKQLLGALWAICLLIFAMGATALVSGGISVSATPAAVVRQIILDAGHGGEDGGAVSAHGTMEKEINLTIALELGRLLTEDGYEVIYTRTRDCMLGTPKDGTIRQKKTADIRARLQVMEEHADAIFVSIHQNKFPQENVRGGQIFYSSKMPRSEALAKLLQKEFALLQKENKRVCKEADSSIYLLQRATIPAVIVECGFLSNFEDEQLLRDEEYQKLLAQTIRQGIKSYCNAG